MRSELPAGVYEERKSPLHTSQGLERDSGISVLGDSSASLLIEVHSLMRGCK